MIVFFQLGSIFGCYMFGTQFVFIFDPSALKEFYKLPENEASFTEATRAFLGLKLPAELLGE